MLIKLSIPIIIFLDFFGWFLIHMLMAYFFTRLPDNYINTNNWLFSTFSWEKSGIMYERVFKIKLWKGLLPDGAALFAGGFRKKHLKDKGIAYYHRFIVETCRGELTHWSVILCTPVFFIWNYGWANIVMIVYALAANLPCILTQRYNRIRLLRLIEKRR